MTAAVEMSPVFLSRHSLEPFARLVVCPRCLAGVGAQCTSYRSGRPAGLSHVLRSAPLQGAWRDGYRTGAHVTRFALTGEETR